MLNNRYFLKSIYYYFLAFWTLLFRVKNIFQVTIAISLKQKFVVKLKNNKIKSRNLGDLWTIKETFLDEDYQKYGFRLSNPKVIIDIGGFIGDFSIWVAEKYPEAHIYAFEPVPENFKLAHENIELNHIKNITSTNKAVTGKSQQGMDILINSKTFGDSGKFVKQGQIIKVETISLKNIFDDFKISSCDLLKMDCEGGEYEIIMNTPETVLKKIKHIVMEYHENVTSFSSKDLVSFLESANYSVEQFSGKTRKDIGFIRAKNND